MLAGAGAPPSERTEWTNSLSACSALVSLFIFCCLVASSFLLLFLPCLFVRRQLKKHQSPQRELRDREPEKTRPRRQAPSGAANQLAARQQARSFFVRRNTHLTTVHRKCVLVCLLPLLPRGSGQGGRAKEQGAALPATGQQGRKPSLSSCYLLVTPLLLLLDRSFSLPLVTGSLLSLLLLLARSLARCRQQRTAPLHQHFNMAPQDRKTVSCDVLEEYFQRVSSLLHLRVTMLISPLSLAYFLIAA